MGSEEIGDRSARNHEFELSKCVTGKRDRSAGSRRHYALYENKITGAVANAGSVQCAEMISPPNQEFHVRNALISVAIDSREESIYIIYFQNPLL